MILDYLLMPMLCVIIAAVTSNKLVPGVPYTAWVLFTAAVITGINLCGIEMTSRATIVFNGVLSISIVWFVVAAVRALLHGTGVGTLFSLKPFYNPSDFSLAAIMSATPIAVLSFLGFDGISTLAEDAQDPQKNVARATVLVCFVAGSHLHSPDVLGPIDLARLYAFQSHRDGLLRYRTTDRWAGPVFSDCLPGDRAGLGQRDHQPGERLASVVRHGARRPLAASTCSATSTRCLRTPIYSVLLMGGIACVGALLLDLDQSAEAGQLRRVPGIHGGQRIRFGPLFCAAAREEWRPHLGKPGLPNARFCHLLLHLAQHLTFGHARGHGLDSGGYCLSGRTDRRLQ